MAITFRGQQYRDDGAPLDAQGNVNAGGSWINPNHPYEGAVLQDSTRTQFEAASIGRDGRGMQVRIPAPAPAPAPAPSTGIIGSAAARPPAPAAPQTAAPGPGPGSGTAAGQQTGMNAMRSEWNGWWDDAQPRTLQTMSGTMTRTGANSATYRNATTGRTFDVTRDTDFASIAGQDEGVAAEWRQRYGFGQNPDGSYGIIAGAAGNSGTSGTGIIAGNQHTPSQLGNPTQWNVTAPQTVEGRINSILNPNNPLQQQARARSLEMANDRGLANSSMAITAGEAAGYDAALPIANADAATFSRAAGYNADQANQFARTNVDSQNAFLQTDRNNAAQRDIAGMQIAGQRDLATINRDTQMQIGRMNIDAQATANQLQQDNATLINTNSQAAQAFNSGLAAINNINLSTTMDAERKTQAVAQVWHSVQTQLRVLGAVSGIDLTGMLSLANSPGFDAQGNWIGFPVDPNAPPTPQATDPNAPGYTGPTLSQGEGGS
jgi:hypothetical protein